MRKRIIRKNKKRIDPRYFLHEHSEKDQGPIEEPIEERTGGGEEFTAPQADLDFAGTAGPKRDTLQSAFKFVKNALETSHPSAWDSLRTTIIQAQGGQSFLDTLDTSIEPSAETASDTHTATGEAGGY